MKVNFERHNGSTIVKVFEDIDFYNSDELEEKLNEILPDVEGIVLSLKDVRYIDSSGLGILTGFLRNCRESGKAFVLAELNNDVKNIFELTRLIDFFQIGDNLEDAMSLMKKNEIKA
ncbi:MAG: STAS domain-containing protein [Candidatus Wallbacteria bacterium]|nr:STAS domain-containing protein [Candidatus Wallbacteria bacterium]